MAFIDDLGLELFTLVLATILPAYMITAAYFYHRKVPMEQVSELIRGSGFPLLVLGIFMLIMGIWGELTWPFPGTMAAYNILFTDPYVIFSLLIVGVSLSLVFHQKLQFVGVLGFFAGIMAIFYGYQAYADNFTKSPFEAFLLYLAFGVVGLFSLPSTIIFDFIEDKKKTKSSPIETLVLAIFWLALIASAIAAGYLAASAVQGHLIATP
ncbi:MAG: DUF981 domain-containing protein [Candidatus Thermoplasmatota archaeon]|jgi:putative membrane protein|nr:DUF981 domain-containing protein [Candidatus Thermoplasmatota archaeon]MCL5786026.1 DUF981 domain-containing protein [Candidatus Thermoplasmatota archaeon]